MRGDRRWVLMALAMAWCSASGIQAEVLDLDRVIVLALGQNPAFQAELERREEVSGAVRETAADAWPQIDLVSSWSRARNPSLLTSPDFDDIIDQLPGGFEPREQELLTMAVEIEQPLYTGGRLEAARRVASLVVEVAEAEIGTAELDLAYTAAEAYYHWLAAREALTSLEAQRRSREASLAVVEARYELAEATELERLRAKASLAEVEPEAARLRGRREVAEHRLRQLLGLGSTVRLEANAEREDPPPPPEPEEIRGLGRRPELTDLERRSDVLTEQRQITRSTARPQLEFRGKYGRQVRLVEDLTDDLFADWQVELGFSLSLFDGGRRKGQLAQLDSQKAQNIWLQKDLKAEIELEVAEALAGYAAAYEALQASRIAADAAAEASRVAEESYELGVALQADLLDARERETAADLDRIESWYQTLTERARLARALGFLPNGPWRTMVEENR